MYTYVHIAHLPYLLYNRFAQNVSINCAVLLPGSRVYKTGHANWSNWNRQFWVHADVLATIDSGISSMHSEICCITHHKEQGPIKAFIFCGLVRAGAAWWFQESMVHLKIRIAWAHCTLSMLSTLTKQSRSITKASWRSVTCLPHRGMRVGNGGYGSSILNGDPQQCSASWRRSEPVNHDGSIKCYSECLGLPFWGDTCSRCMATKT